MSCLKRRLNKVAASDHRAKATHPQPQNNAPEKAKNLSWREILDRIEDLEVRLNSVEGMS